MFYLVNLLFVKVGVKRRQNWNVNGGRTAQNTASDGVVTPGHGPCQKEVLRGCGSDKRPGCGQCIASLQSIRRRRSSPGYRTVGKSTQVSQHLDVEPKLFDFAFCGI